MGVGEPSVSTTAADRPGRARVAQPGLGASAAVAGSAPEAPAGCQQPSCGRGDMTQEPVSDCHHVSMTGAVPEPTSRRSQDQASGLTDSPTVPTSRTEDRSQRSAGRSPGAGCDPNAPMCERTSVGAV